VALALVSASCASPLMTLPPGPGAPAGDGREALTQATTACRAVRTISAEVGVSGSVGGHRVRGQLLVGLADPAAVRLEALAPAGPPVFIFVARADTATVLVSNDNRFLERGEPTAVLEAMTGVPLGPDELRLVLIGCVAGADSAAVQQLGDDWRLARDATTDTYLHRTSGTAPWRVVASIRKAGDSTGWRAEYAGGAQGLPSAVRVTALDGHRFDLQLALSQVEINQPLGDDVFRVRIPGGAEAITLEDLRRSGPLGGRK